MITVTNRIRAAALAGFLALGVAVAPVASADEFGTLIEYTPAPKPDPAVGTVDAVEALGQSICKVFNAGGVTVRTVSTVGDILIDPESTALSAMDAALVMVKSTQQFCPRHTQPLVSLLDAIQDN